MDTRLTTTHLTWRLLLAIIMALALLMTLGATPALGAKAARVLVGRDRELGLQRQPRTF